MTAQEFNKKWERHLEDGYYGMAFDDEIPQYVDEKFEEMLKEFPNFTYSQIKLKFGQPRVYMEYCGNYDREIERGISKILVKKRNEEVHK